MVCEDYFWLWGLMKEGGLLRLVHRFYADELTLDVC